MLKLQDAPTGGGGAPWKKRREIERERETSTNSRCTSCKTLKISDAESVELSLGFQVQLHSLENLESHTGISSEGIFMGHNLQRPLVALGNFGGATCKNPAGISDAQPEAPND